MADMRFHYKGFFSRNEKKPHISTHLSSTFYKKSTLPITFFDAWEGSPLG